MTVERIEGTAQADDTAAEADTSEATAVTEPPATDTDDTATTSDAATSATADETATTPEDHSAADDAAADAAPEAGAAGEVTASATAEDGGGAGNGMGTADPSEETAIGASGARSLGDATQVSDRVNEAVERMQARSDAAEGSGANGSTPDSSAVEAADDTLVADDAPAADDTLEADEAPARNAETPADDAPAATASAPAPRVYDGPEPTTMEELLNEQATEIRSLKHGDVVEGNVVRIDKDEILVDIGAKSEGVISNRELYGRNAETQPQLNIGDQVLVYVLQPESPEGHAVLSLRRAGLERKWRAMQEQLDAGAIIEAPVIDHNKGGLIVDCGIRGFVPISQIVDFPRRPQNEQPRDAAQEIAEKLQPYVGRKLRLKILEVNRKANRLILSEKVALYEERREKRDELFSSLQVGQKVTGSVRSIAPFGVFIDLGGIDGLVHKSELSWNKVNNPESGYRVGEEVEAEVIDINHERGRISLSIRRLQPDPWHSTVADLKVGDIIDGTVTKIVNFGAFVRVRDGLEGLIHISELSHARVAHPGDVVHEGQTIKLKIISLEQERHRLGLSLKQAEEAPARPERPAAPRGERRPRPERGYDASQAVQEPEGGIDNTLAAAFAQVRAQMEQTEAARSAVDYDEATEAPAADGTVEAPPAEDVADAPPAEDVADAPPAEDVADAPPADEVTGDAGAQLGEAPAANDAVAGTDEPEIAAETDDAPAVQVGAAKPSRKASRQSDATTAEAPAGDDDAATTDEQPATTAEPAEGSEEPSAEQLPATTADPSEGADDAAPGDGADREETSG